MGKFTLIVETRNAAFDAVLPAPRWPYPAGMDYLAALDAAGDTEAADREVILEYLRRH